MFRMFLFLLFLNVVGAGFIFYKVSSVDHDPTVWHVDPLVEPQSVKPHSYRVAPPALTQEFVDFPAPVYTANPTLMAKAFDDFVLRQPKTIRIAGSVEEGWMTYVQRSERLNFPDYISVKFIDLNGGRSTVAIYSRSRFGYSDMGVNAARVNGWLASLRSFEDETAVITEEPEIIGQDQ